MSNAVESDMSRFHGFDMRDRWRFDEQGHRKLTLRMIYVRVIALPSNSALAIEQNGGKQPWTWNEYLLSDLWAQQANKGRRKGAKPVMHPERPKPEKALTPEQRSRKLKAQARHRRKVAQRERQLAKKEV